MGSHQIAQRSLHITCLFFGQRFRYITLILLGSLGSLSLVASPAQNAGDTTPRGDAFTINWGFVTTANAKTTEDSIFKKMIKRAQENYKNKRYQEAIKYFKDAMVLRSNPNIHWNLSVCYHKLNNYPKALFHVNEYLKLGQPSAKMKEKASARRVELLSALEERLDTRVSPAVGGASVRTNNRPDLQGVSTTGRGQLGPDRGEASPDDEIRIHEALRAEQQNKRTGIIWGIVGLSSVVIGAGVHLYADLIWEDRPSGGGAGAIQARSDAITTSWVGDGVLVAGLTCLIVGGVYYWSQPATTVHASEYSSFRRSLTGDSSLQTLPAHRSSRDGTRHITYAPVHTPREVTPSAFIFNLLQAPPTTRARSTKTAGALIGWRRSF